MSRVFADTAFFVALISTRDSHHSLADRLGREFNGRIITTQWILLEVANFFASSSERATATRFIQALLRDQQTERIAVSSESFREGWDLYCSRIDKGWSLTDCISFCAMQARGVAQALTSDHHFEQAGYEILLK